jgi:hypothetical protein
MRLFFILLISILLSGCIDKETNAQCEYCCEFYNGLVPKKSIFLIAMDKSGSVSSSQITPIHNFVMNKSVDHPSFGFGSKFFTTVFASDASTISWNIPNYEMLPISIPNGLSKRLKTKTSGACKGAMKFLDEEKSRVKTGPLNFLKSSFSSVLPTGLKKNRTKVLSVIKSIHEWSSENQSTGATLITFFVTDYKFSDMKDVKDFLQGKRFRNVSVIQTQPTDNISSEPRSKFLNLLKAHGVQVVTQ